MVALNAVPRSGLDLEEAVLSVWSAPGLDDGNGRTAVDPLNGFASALAGALTQCIVDALRVVVQEQAADTRALRDAMNQQLRQHEELTSKVSALVERLDHHAAVIRTRCQGQSLGEAALDQFVEVWTRLKTSTAPPPPLTADF
jgi:hypothetical protein